MRFFARRRVAVRGASSVAGPSASASISGRVLAHDRLGGRLAVRGGRLLLVRRAVRRRHVDLRRPLAALLAGFGFGFGALDRLRRGLLLDLPPRPRARRPRRRRPRSRPARRRRSRASSGACRRASHAASACGPELRARSRPRSRSRRPSASRPPEPRRRPRRPRRARAPRTAPRPSPARPRRSFAAQGARVGFSASLSNVIGAGAVPESTSVANAWPSSTRPTTTFAFLPTSFAVSATTTSKPSSLPTPPPTSWRPSSTSFSSTSAPSSTGAAGAGRRACPRRGPRSGRRGRGPRRARGRTGGAWRPRARRAARRRARRGAPASAGGARPGRPGRASLRRRPRARAGAARPGARSVASETTMPSPPQVGHLRVMISRGPSVTFCRVISTSPSGEISTT